MKGALEMLFRNRFMSLATAAGSLLALSLSGCADPPSPPLQAFASGDANPIQISRSRLVHAVRFADHAPAADSGQISELFQFVAANSVGPADTVLVERGDGALAQVRAASLAATLSSAGLHPLVVADAQTPAEIARVVIERYVAIAPDCPDWSGPPGPGFRNYNEKNFGCADAKNLAAMVADPKDLAIGAALPAQAGDPATLPVHRYREGLTAMRIGAGSGAAGATTGGAGSGAPGASAGGGPGPSGPN